jgi:hypothetical protein
MGNRKLWLIAGAAILVLSPAVKTINSVQTESWQNTSQELISKLNAGQGELVRKLQQGGQTCFVKPGSLPECAK